MAASGWIRKWKSPQNGLRDGISRGGTLVRAAAKGDSLDHLLDLGVRRLLVAAHADRAGLWLVSGRHAGFARGRVIENTAGPVPEQWKSLDLSKPLVRTALESSEPLRFEYGLDDTMPDLGLLAGMHSAIWIPVRIKNRTLGLAMVANERTSFHPDMNALQACADEIALAVRHSRESRRQDLVSDEIRAQLRLSRAILCGVSADSILPQIARAARHHVGAEFIALGRESEPPLSRDGWDGPEEWLSTIHQGSFLQLWRKTFAEGRECEIPGGVLPSSQSYASESLSDSSNFVLDRVIAIPIEVRNVVRAVLMAGLTSSRINSEEVTAEDFGEDIARLESYALLAASALDREIARDERAASKGVLRNIIENSQDNFAVIDEKGVVCDTSRAAAALLFPTWGRLDETILEDFFSSDARDAVAQWRAQLGFHSSSQFTSNPNSLYSDFAKASGRTEPALEASLHRGTVVRMEVRSKLEGFGGEQPKWLVQFEDQNAKRIAKSDEGRLEAEIAGLVDSIESGVLLLDDAGNIRMVSDRLAAILGFETRRLVEMRTIEALIDNVAPHFTRPVETATHWREHVRRGDEACWDEFELTYPSRRIVERFARPLFRRDGSRLGWLEVYRDITGQRLIQSKLLQTEKMAALGQLVSGIAHELNNPLTSIQGYAQLLLSRRSASDRTGDALRISQEAERAGRIVKNLLLFSRETKPERHAVDLTEVIERTLSLRSYELKLQNIDVELALDSNLPHMLADAAQLQQVVLNLIVNAEQAIVLGRGEDARHGRILIRTRRLAGDRIAMEVADDGPGISPEAVSRIFDPFFTTKPAGVGTGLGLSIVYGIIQAHGGEVSVESQPGQGATLIVELPALAGTGFASMPKPPQATPISVAPADLSSLIPNSFSTYTKGVGSPQRILVVEDEPTVAELIADVLTEEGHRVDTLLDSRDALERLEEREYALIVCDLKMPYVDGPALYRELVRRDSPLQHRFLFVTGDTMSPRTLEFLKSSGLPFLAKPFLVGELKEAVSMAFTTVEESLDVPVSEDKVEFSGLPRSVARVK